MNKETDLTIFATYWNEKDWIHASLDQIDKINPKEVIICDGCFDPTEKNKSTDGTRRIIEKWVSQREGAQMISAKRFSKIKGVSYIFLQNFDIKYLPLRLMLAVYYLNSNVYRINQAATFNFMSRLSIYWKPGNWFMTMDADQFYSDQMIEKFREICGNSSSQIDLVTGQEKTFFENFEKYTEEYESRCYNNMPHRIKENTIILPTRDVMLEEYPKPELYVENTEIRKQFAGSYFHYKFRPLNKSREQKTYQLGDREKPDTSDYSFKKYNGDHPAVVENALAEN